MINLLNEATDAAVQTLDWGKVIIEFIVALAAVFTCTGFWELRKAKFQAKREDKKEEKNYDVKLDKISEQVSEISKQSKNQFIAVETKVDTLAEDVQEMKKDLVILQQANEATVKYRELRDSRDKEAIAVQEAFIESITGLMRDRLLDNYRRCMKKGYYTMEEREIYGKMFECYEKPPFRGNGVMHDLRPIMKALPMLPPEEDDDE